MSVEGRSEPQSGSAIVGRLADWVQWTARHPRRVLAVAALVTGAAFVYSAGAVRLNSDDSSLISQDLPFRQDFKALVEHFPELEKTTLIVLSSASLDMVEDATDRLSAALEARPDLISTLYAPSAEPFFEDHAFLYIDEDELERVVDRLAQAQPALAALVEDPSLRGLFDELELSMDELEDQGELPIGFARMADRVSDTTASMLEGRPRRLGWADELMAADETVYRLLVIQGRVYFDEEIASEKLIDGIRGLAKALQITPENGVTVRLTGMVPLAHEEQLSVRGGLEVAGILAVSLLTVILGYGLRSLRIVVSTFVTLIASLGWTTAYAMLVVGEFNIISASFAVLLIGLGVDFAIHIGLRYEEATREGVPVPEALGLATRGVGGAVALCGLTSAIGFMSFLPTQYQGLADLGVIAGGGMLLSVVASFTVFPALLALMRAPTSQQDKLTPLARIYPVIVEHAGLIVGVTAVLTILVVTVSFQMHFDFSTLGLKNPETESMTTLRELQDEDIVTDYTATVLAPNLEEAEVIAERLRALDVVSKVRSPLSYVPKNQTEKFALIEDAAFFLESVLYPIPPQPAPTRDENRIATEALRARIAALPPGNDDDPSWQAARRLGALLQQVLARPDANERVNDLEQLVVSDLGDRIEWLRRALMVEPVTFDDLPNSIRRRLISEDSQLVRVVAMPEGDMGDVESITRFTEAVAAIAPHATGRPALETAIGGIVVGTFRTAVVIAVAAISLILFYTLRNPFDVLMVLAPITLAAFMTVAFGVLVDIPFNMANVVVIPLVLGLGVDNGIHVYLRYRNDGSLANMMYSSTPRAVLLSASTTLAAFGSLAVSDHFGIHSMGVLLSVSVVALTLCTLIVLPAMILVRERFFGPRSVR